MSSPVEKDLSDDYQTSLTRLEDRLSRIEEYLGIGELEARQTVDEVELTTSESAVAANESLEFHVGQNWFAKIGIVILTIGLAFTLSLPLRDLPPVAPALIGYGLALMMFAFSRFWQRSFEMVSRYFRWAAMALLYFATLRLSYFGHEPVLSAASLPGAGLLVTVVVFNLWVGIRRKSPFLVTMGILLGMTTTLAVGSPWFVLIGLTLLCGFLLYVRIWFDWKVVFLVHIPLVYVTYLIWALNNPLLGNGVLLLHEPAAAPWFLPAYTLILAAGSFCRKNLGLEDPTTVAAAVFICGCSYLLFLLQTLRAPIAVFTISHLVVALVYIGLATAFWLREGSRGATFFYAMTGYAAISLTIIRAVPVPDVFVWLSLQSLLVVTTAIWFRSRFIVVANFFIFLCIVTCYVFMITVETGISLGFGLVALISARVLNWQKERMELETHLMRNAYLLSAFLIFPYAVAHLVPPALVALGWCGIAVVYYSLNFIVHNLKYRWMGHGTLVLAVLYVIVMGIGRLEPLYRNLSFLVLGSMLLVVSLIFTTVHAKRRKDEKEPETE